MKNILTICLLTICNLLSAQCVEIYFQPMVNVDQVQVDVKAIGFSDIAAFQFGINYNDQKMILDSIGNFNILGLNQGNFNGNNVGSVYVAYTNPSPNNTVGLEDNETAFSLYFTIISGGISEISLAPTEEFHIEYVNGNLEILCLEGENGIVIGEGSTLAGSVIFDANSNCMTDVDETSLGGWLVHVYSAQYDLYRLTKADGTYTFLLPPGEYNIELFPKNELWAVCDHTDILVVIDNNQTFAVDLYALAAMICPRMNVDIAAPFLRRCFSSTYNVTYENDGTAIAEDAYVEVELDPFLIFESTTASSYSVDGGIYTFPLGDLEIGQSGSFNITVSVDCEETLLGQTHCTTAHAYPDEWCNPLLEWNGANLEIEAVCEGDSVRFLITNTGIGDMLMPTEFIVVEDDVMIETNPIWLEAQATYQAAYPANGATFRGQATQVSDHPSIGFPVAVIELCGNDQGNSSLGFVNMFSDGDDDPFISIDCQENIGAFDPNDKRSFPKGYKENHLIKANTDIEYLIRFQNTGTDTAFNVVVEDRLSENLDITSIKTGASSHKYALTIQEDRTLVFSFEDILLVDSTTNEAGSHGFVKLFVSQMPNLADGAIILNDANIYFDFNEPVLTNQVELQIGSNFVEVVSGINEPIFNKAVSIVPNPSLGSARITLLDVQDMDEYQLRIMDINGKVVVSEQMNNNSYAIHAESWKKGLYIVEIWSLSGFHTTGKIIIQ